jgi:hypothetical protein
MKSFLWWAWQLTIPVVICLAGATGIYFGLTAKGAGEAISGVVFGLFFFIYPILYFVQSIKSGTFGAGSNRF